MSQMDSTRTDVAIVGAGIAGSAVAILLARAGISVCLLEKTAFPEDKVRGEFLVPWGVAIARDLDILGIFERAGGNYTSWAVPFGRVGRSGQAPRP